jgi:hypothetical protein
MRSIRTPSNGQVVTYPPCQPWCFYQPEDHDGTVNFAICVAGMIDGLLLG